MFEYAIHTADSLNTVLHYHFIDGPAANEQLSPDVEFHYIGIVDEQGREYDFRGERDAGLFCADCDMEAVNYDFVDGHADADIYHDGKYVGRFEVPVRVEVRYCVNAEN